MTQEFQSWIYFHKDLLFVACDSYRGQFKFSWSRFINSSLSPSQKIFILHTKWKCPFLEPSKEENGQFVKYSSQNKIFVLFCLPKKKNIFAFEMFHLDDHFGGFSGSVVSVNKVWDNALGENGVAARNVKSWNMKTWKVDNFR